MKPSEVSTSLQIVEVRPGMKFSLGVLKQILPTVELALFFCKAFSLSVNESTNVLRQVHNCSVLEALTGGDHLHSHELQDYVLSLGYYSMIESGEIAFDLTPPKGEILPELWKSMQIEVAQSIKDVAEKLKDVVGEMPGKEGEMLFKSMLTVNAKRPVLGDYKAHIHHARQRENLVILDVSGSMSEETVTTIIEDVVALSYMANAHLAIVSNKAVHWGPGEYNSEVVLKVAEFAGTHYEELAPLLDQDWGVVVTIADYDSSRAAEAQIAKCTGSIETLLDISLVGRPTYLAEVVGQLAVEVKPLLVASSDLTRNSW